MNTANEPPNLHSGKERARSNCDEGVGIPAGRTSRGRRRNTNGGALSGIWRGSDLGSAGSGGTQPPAESPM